MNAMTAITAEALTPAQITLADSAARQIRDYQKRSTAEMLEIGALLNTVKGELPHGAFLEWLDRAVGWTPRTAQNYMKAAAAFAEKCATVSHLPPSLVYRLAAQPDDVRDRALSVIDDPSAPPVDAVQRVVDDARDRRRKAALAATRRDRLTPERAAREERRRAAEGAAREREEAEAREAADALVVLLDGRQRAALAALLGRGVHLVARALAAAMEGRP
jgi:hypothetical protein